MFGTSTEQSIWNPGFFEQGGLFDVFKPWSEWFLHHRTAFPSLDSLSEAALQESVAPVLSGGGFPVRFVRQQRILRHQRPDLGWRANYQLRIFFAGEVPSRPANWHDFFNAWTWLFLPKLKAAINTRHFHCIDETIPFPWKMAGGNRNREQDLLTVFDEGGLLVVTEDEELWQCITERRWQDLFLKNAEQLQRRVRFVPVGHALFECALKNHPRLHASCIRVRANPEKLSFVDGRAWRKSLAAIDEQAAQILVGRTQLRSPDDLFALPIWGIPGWHPRAGDPGFIADPSYFR